MNMQDPYPDDDMIFIFSAVSPLLVSKLGGGGGHIENTKLQDPVI